jgi:hypothetical protein
MRYPPGFFQVASWAKVEAIFTRAVKEAGKLGPKATRSL